MTIDITAIVQALVALIAAVLTAVVVPWIRAELTAAQYKKFLTLVDIAVQAAEQIFAGSKRGAEKKQYVVDWLAARGITLDSAELDAMIEAAVLDLRRAA